MVLGVFLNLFSMIVLPWLATNVPDMVDGLNSDLAMLVTFSVGLIAELTGTIMLAIPLAGRCSLAHRTRRSVAERRDQSGFESGADAAHGCRRSARS
jgi:hypothetical protein